MPIFWLMHCSRCHRPQSSAIAEAALRNRGHRTASPLSRGRVLSLAITAILATKSQLFVPVRNMKLSYVNSATCHHRYASLRNATIDSQTFL